MEKIKPSDLHLNFSTNLFFDTNIWLFLFGSIASYEEKRQKHYSRLFYDAVQKNCSIYITSMVMSEFANVILRREFNKWKKDTGNHAAQYKKDFVGTEAYEEKTELVKNQLNKILNLPNILRAPDSFNNINISSIFSNFGLADFNDAYINELVSSNDLILVTDDGDFEKIYRGKKLVSLS